MATTNIYQGQDSKGSSAAFVTPEAAVFDEKGVCLKDKLANIDPDSVQSVVDKAKEDLELQVGIWSEELANSSTLIEVVFDTDNATTRKKVPVAKRHKGVVITYFDEAGRPVLEKYIGTSISEADFAMDKNWVQYVTKDKLDSLNSDIVSLKKELENLKNAE